MANDNHLFPVTCYNVTMQKQDYYNEFFELGQQKINFSFFELHLPDDDPVYTLKKIMEKIDFSSLLARYSSKGRSGYNPIMMYALVTYANMRGVRAVDRIVELCQRDLAFIWLAKGQKPKRDAFYDFKGEKLEVEVLDDLHYQFIRYLEKHKEAFEDFPKEVTADSGYCSEKNLLYLRNNHICGYIKLQNHEQRKTRSYSEDISKYYNMKFQIYEDESYYICHDGRDLRHICTETKQQEGYVQTFEVYGYEDCSECEHKAKCLYKYNAEKDQGKNKIMKINEQWESLKEKTYAKIQSDKGILNRQIRSIQTEGHFGDIKENENFRRFNYRTTEKVYKEFMLYVIGRNMNKYHRFLHGEIQKFEGKEEQKTA